MMLQLRAAGARSEHGPTKSQPKMKKIALPPAIAIALALATPVFAAEDTGARLYFNHCAACHGDNGEGTGPVASSMRVTVPNLRSLAQRNGGMFPVDSVRAYVDGRSIPAAHGDRLMPIWGDVFLGADQNADDRTVRRRIAAVVEFISTLQYRELLP